MAVLFIILENYEPQLHAYRLIPFEFREDAETHAQKLIDSFKKDQIFDALKSKLIAWTRAILDS